MDEFGSGTPYKFFWKNLPIIRKLFRTEEGKPAATPLPDKPVGEVSSDTKPEDNK